MTASTLTWESFYISLYILVYKSIFSLVRPLNFFCINLTTPKKSTCILQPVTKNTGFLSGELLIQLCKRKNLIPVIKHGGGSIRIWDDLQQLVRAKLYTLTRFGKIPSNFEGICLASVQKLCLCRDCNFQQSNDLKH